MVPHMSWKYSGDGTGDKVETKANYLLSSGRKTKKSCSTIVVLFTLSQHQWTHLSVDLEETLLRPESFMDFVGLIWKVGFHPSLSDEDIYFYFLSVQPQFRSESCI